MKNKHVESAEVLTSQKIIRITRNRANKILMFHAYYKTTDARVKRLAALFPKKSHFSGSIYYYGV